MSQPEPFLKLGLNEPQPPDAPREEVPAANDLQFSHAEFRSETPASTAQQCAFCHRAITDTYFHVQGQVVCPECTSAIEAKQKAPPAHLLLKAFAYGLAAAVAGCAIYATFAILTGYELALIAILIGYMVGSAIRKASRGLGGRPQQILAVCLTYFAITTSYIPVGIYQHIHNPNRASQQTSTAGTDSAGAGAPSSQKPAMSLGAALATMLLLALAAPFLGLAHGTGAFISLLIIFFGMQRAWHIGGRTDLLIMGPYRTEA
jgi:hypothetical protein